MNDKKPKKIKPDLDELKKNKNRRRLVWSNDGTHDIYRNLQLGPVSEEARIWRALADNQSTTHNQNLTTPFTHTPFLLEVYRSRSSLVKSSLKRTYRDI